VGGGKSNPSLRGGELPFYNDRDGRVLCLRRKRWEGVGRNKLAKGEKETGEIQSDRKERKLFEKRGVSVSLFKKKGWWGVGGGGGGGVGGGVGWGGFCCGWGCGWGGGWGWCLTGTRRVATHILSALQRRGQEKPKGEAIDPGGRSATRPSVFRKKQG